MRKNLFKSVIVSVAVLILAAALCGCSFNGGKKNTEYVESVRENVHQTVNLTRNLREQLEELNFSNPSSVQECTETLDSLSDIYSSLVTLESPDRYDDLDDEIKPASENALTSISKLKMFISAASEGDSSGYDRNHEKIMEEYTSSYNELVDLSSMVQTRYRND